MSSQDPAQALERAKADLAAHEARRLPAGACLHDWMAERSRLTDEIRKAERSLAAARGEEHPEIWDGVPFLHLAPLPRVFLRDRDRITVLAAVKYVPPEWKGKIAGEDFSYGDNRPVARIDFRDARHRWSIPGVSGIERHPLFGRGLDPFRPQRVVNSSWKGPGWHHLLMFESASLEVLGLP